MALVLINVSREVLERERSKTFKNNVTVLILRFTKVVFPLDSFANRNAATITLEL